ncbi:hypothetical protein WDW89_11475 [Deltaproteobacteria bacterium TL4]
MNEFKKAIEATVEEMIEFQKKKVLKIAREIVPGATPEDIRNPQDFPDLYYDFYFNYEDGILTGYLSVQKAIQARINELIHPLELHSA